eukprot:TRINITY_DN4379_c1_g4_i1.p1 TRINITY_DN4379_c1_g4~~TRINITY_DN4379_c1_g4_i1.p1  ORF type:complete len:293 (+),score=136.47 TRINITY_DN4379_c1_g4_i1:61-939(+)
MAGNLGINNAIFEFCMKHSDDPKNLTEGIPERDPADYDFLREALASIKTDYERMENCLNIFTSTEITDVESKEIAMEEMIYYVEDLDNAGDFCKKMKGGRLILAMLTSDTPPSLREGAAFIAGTCAQNNIVCQAILLADGMLQRLVEQLRVEEHDGVRAKLIFAISSLVRGNKDICTAFARIPNSVAAVADVVSKHPADIRSVKKALFLLAALYRDDPESASVLPSIPHDATLLAAVKDVLKHEEATVHEFAVEYVAQLVSHGQKAAVLAAGITADLVSDEDEKKKLAAVLA